jgi:hypothetical protein
MVHRRKMRPVEIDVIRVQVCQVDRVQRLAGVQPKAEDAVSLDYPAVSPAHTARDLHRGRVDFKRGKSSIFVVMRELIEQDGRLPVSVPIPQFSDASRLDYVNLVGIQVVEVFKDFSECFRSLAEHRVPAVHELIEVSHDDILIVVQGEKEQQKITQSLAKCGVSSALDIYDAGVIGVGRDLFAG